MYIPVSYMGEEPVEATVYTLNKEYEITKQGLRRWKSEKKVEELRHITARLINAWKERM